MESISKGVNCNQLSRENGFKLPEYLEMAEVSALIAAAPNLKARLIMLEQWRAGLRVSEALALEARDLHLDSDRPTLVVRQGKRRKPRVVPVHPGAADGPDRGHQSRGRWPGQVDRSFPRHGLEVGAAGGPSGH